MVQLVSCPIFSWSCGLGHGSDTISLHVNIHQSLWIKCRLPPLSSHTASVLLLLTPALIHSGSCVRSFNPPPPPNPPYGGFLQSMHWSPEDTDRHLRELHWCLCVSVSVQQQGSHCEIRLHAGTNWTQGSLTCIVDHAHYLAYLHLLIRPSVCLFQLSWRKKTNWT